MASIIEAYMDDSGSHDEAPLSVIAGYVGGHRRWLEFEPRWRDVLNKYSVTEFHAQRFWHRSKDPKRTPKVGPKFNEFDGWSENKATAFLNELLTIIQTSRRIHPFVSGVVNSEWSQQSLADRRMFTGATDKYPTGKPSKSMFMAFRRCFIRTAAYCKPGVKVYYFIDDDKQTNSAWATICYSELKRSFKNDRDELYAALGDLTPADSVDAVPLQAADLLAYEARKYGEQLLAMNGEYPPVGEVYGRAVINLRALDDFWMFDKSRFDWIANLKKQAGV